MLSIWVATIKNVRFRTMPLDTDMIPAAPTALFLDTDQDIAPADLISAGWLGSALC